MSRTADDFLREIAASPEDDGLKAVFSDWLLERGDPRGELIALQLKARPSDEDLSRVALLIKKHADRWLPPDVMINVDRSSLEFEKGMLAGARIAVRSPSAMAASLGHPVWATVTRLASPPPELVPSCPHLEALTEVDDLTLSNLAARGEPLGELRTLGVHGRSPRTLAWAFGSSVFTEVTELRLGFPMTSEGNDEDDARRSLRALEPERLGWLFRLGFGEGLQRLVLHTGWTDLTPWLHRLDAAIPEIQLTPMVFEPTNWWIRFEPGRSVVVFPGSELNASFSESPVREILATAPRGYFARLALPAHLGWASVRRLPCFERAEIVSWPGT